MLKGIQADKTKLSKEKAFDEIKQVQKANDSTMNNEKSETPRGNKALPSSKNIEQKGSTLSKPRESKAAKQSKLVSGMDVVSLSKSSTILEMKPTKTKASSEGSHQVSKFPVIREENENVRYFVTGRKKQRRKSSRQSPGVTNENVKISNAAELIRSFFQGVQTRKDLKQWVEKPEISKRDEKYKELSTDPILRYLLYQTRKSDLINIQPALHFPLKDVPQFIGSVHSENTPIVLITGGINPTNYHDIFAAGGMVLRYDPNENVLNRYSMMPVPRHNHRMVYNNGFLYVIGGYDPRVTIKGHLVACNTCYRYELATNTWQRLSDMNHARVYHGAVVLNNAIFVIGGKDHDGKLLESVEKYDEKDDHWMLLQPGISIARMAMGVTVHKGMIWVAGGLVLKPTEGNLCLVRIVERYDYAKNSWTLLKSRIPVPVAFPSLCSTKSSLFLVGGAILDKRSEMSIKSVKNVLRYNEDEDLWEPDSDLQSARHDAATTTIGNALYVVGGCDSTSMRVLNDIEEYNTVSHSSRKLQELPIAATGSATITLPVVTEL